MEAESGSNLLVRFVMGLISVAAAVVMALVVRWIRRALKARASQK